MLRYYALVKIRKFDNNCILFLANRLFRMMKVIQEYILLGWQLSDCGVCH